MFIFMRKMNSSRWKDAGLVLAYMIFYLCFFNYLEHRTGVQVHMLQMRADYKIPSVNTLLFPIFCGSLMWDSPQCILLYSTITGQNFISLLSAWGIGMTLFLMISYVFRMARI